MSKVKIVTWMDRGQMRLRRWRTALDPETRRWVDASRAAVEDGSIWRDLEKQREVGAIVDEWRRSRPQ